MTHEELRQAAIDCLAVAFKGGGSEAHVVQAAVTIALSPAPGAALKPYDEPDEVVTALRPE